MASLFFLILKYEIKSFFRYIQSKRSRVFGLVFGLILFGLYVYGVFFVFGNPFVSQMLLEYKDILLQSMISGVFLMCILAIIGGFSILTTVRKGQKNRINLMLQSPYRPHSVVLDFLVINAIIVMLYYTLMAYPTILALLIALRIDMLYILLFFFSLTLAIIGFATIGCMLGIVYVKLTGKQKRYLAMILAGIGAYVYSLIYSPSGYALQILMFFNGILNNVFSPFRWIAAPLFFGYDPIEYLEFVLGTIFSVVLIEASSEYLTGKYLKGTIKPPKEKVMAKYKYGRGIIDKIYGKEVGAIFRKEIKIFAREPAMISGFLFAYVLLIIVMLNIIQEGADDPLFGLTFVLMLSIIMSIVPSISMTPTALAMEKKNMAILLSSPIEYSKIVRGKALLSELLSIISVFMLLPFIFILIADVVTILFICLLLIDIVIVMSALSTYIAVKYTNFRAENPRKALKMTGTIILVSVMMALYGLVPAFIVFIYMIGAMQYCLVGVIVLFPPSLIVRKMFLAKAGKTLANLGATEYL